MVTKVDLRTNDTRKRVIAEAKRLYLMGGYNHVSMDKIAEILGLKRPTLYYHFPGGKEQLLVETINVTATEMVNAWREVIEAGHDTRTRLRNILDVVTDYPIPENKRTLLVELWQLGQQVQDTVKHVYVQIYGLLSQVFEEGIQTGEIRELEVELMVHSFMSVYDQVENLLAIKQDFAELSPVVSKFDQNELIDKIFDLWMNGLQASK